MVQKAFPHRSSICVSRQVIAEQGAEINGAALKGMTYLDAVIREILRLHPIVGGAFRKAIKDFDLGGYRIPKASVQDLTVFHTAVHGRRDTHLGGFCSAMRRIRSSFSKSSSTGCTSSSFGITSLVGG